MVHILCGGCEGWWRKMVLTVLQVLFFFKNIFEVLDGLCVWIEV